jgi:hypothetical protein
MSSKGVRKEDHSVANRKAIFAMLLLHVQDGALKRGSFVRVAEHVGTSVDAVRKIWRAVLLNMEAHLAADDNPDPLLLLDELSLPLSKFPDHVFENNRSNCGRKRKYDRVVLAERTAQLPLNERSTHRNHAAALGISVKTSWTLANEKNSSLRIVTSDIKPALTAENKKNRLIYALSFVDPRVVTTRYSPNEWQFREMFEDVHVDEKWFYLTKVARRYIMGAQEEDPKRSTRHKSHVEKVMFLCAQARPRMDPSTKTMWDGKLGIYPIGEYYQAQKNTKKQNRGDLKWKNMNVNAEVYLETMREVVIQIAETWPRGQWQNPLFKVRIQQDGAKAHTSDSFKLSWNIMMEDLVMEGVLPHADKVVLETQPPNSPDLNILDLGLFSAIQAAYYRFAPRNALELIDCVEKAYVGYPANKINHLWLSLQLCMNQIIEHDGCNHYKIPHINKAKLEREGRLPASIQVTPSARAKLEKVCSEEGGTTTEADNFAEDIDNEPLPPCLTRAEVDGLVERLVDENKEN